MSQMANSTPSAFSGPCEHKAEIGCVLTAVPVCCSCADKRPIAPAYPVYIDGQGMKMQGKRWARYCWKCRDFYNHVHSEPPQTSEDLHQPSPQTQTDMSNFHRHNHQISQLDPLARSFPTPNSMDWQLATYQQTVPGWRSEMTNSQNTPVPIAQRANSSSHSHLSGRQSPPPQRPQAYPLGTREDAEQEDYQSPISVMFRNAYSRYQTAEQVRREHAAALGIPAHAIRTIDPLSQHPSHLQGPPGLPQTYISVGQPLYPGTSIRLGYPAFAPQQAPTPFEPYNPNHEHGPAPMVTAFDETNAIDRQANRPPRLTTEEMTIAFECKICMEQKIDTLIEPCMHLAMCRWCSEEWQAHARVLRRQDPNMTHPWKCPVCRRGIQQTRRVYL